VANEPRYIVVGGGLAGLMTVIKLAELGKNVDLFSFQPVKRSHSVCAQGGINGAVNTKGEGDHPEIHFVDSVKGGDFLAHQPLVKGMCYAAPNIIYLLDRMGVPFTRTAEGLIDFRRFGGTLHNRTAFAGATTGQQLLYALDEQVRRYEAEGKVTKYEGWEYLGMVKSDDGRCRGIVAINLRSMEVRSFQGVATALATGGCGLVYGKSTMSMTCTGTAAGSAYLEGVKYANGEFIQVHPTAIPAPDKLRLMSESARGEGGRVWTLKDGKPWYFLEEKYPRFKNLVPRDVASREIFKVVNDMKLGIDGKDMVYLDVTELKPEKQEKLAGILEIYEKFIGEDPRRVPMKIYPGVHYTMGGIWVDYQPSSDGFVETVHPKNHQTNVPGLFAVGESDYQYHGANRLGANSLLSCIYGGMLTGPAMAAYASAKDLGDAKLGDGDRSVTKWREKLDGLRKMDGKENAYILHKELGEVMTRNVTIVRENKKLDETLVKIKELKARWKKCNPLDKNPGYNQPLLFLNHLWNMLELAHIITKGARNRDECRGAHYKPEFDISPPKETEGPEFDAYKKKWHDNNEKWLKSTIALPGKDGDPELTYEDVNTSLVEPKPRKYD
jgi:succinate dehydrogenase / fumarate reductase flavoprotein subunit